MTINSYGDVSMESELHVNSKIGIGTSTPTVSLDVSATDALKVPVGTDAERPSPEKGQIRYNTDTDQFEGYGGAWEGLGGVIDQDQDTKVYTDDNNNILFESNGALAMRIDSYGDISMMNDLNVYGHSSLTSLEVESLTTLKGDVNIGSLENDVSMVLYGYLRIKSGGNIVIEDDDVSITQLKTEVRITDQLDITNDGTGPALTVRQDDSNGNDIAHFKDKDVSVFTIGDSGKTFIMGDVSMNASLDVSQSLVVNNELSVAGDSAIGGTLRLSSHIAHSHKNITKFGFYDTDVFSIDISDQEILRVDSSGVGIGTSIPNYELDVYGDIHNTGTLYSDSDINLKKNIIALNNSLDKVSKLNGYYYHKNNETDSSLRHIGVIAQEVEKEYPELVSNVSKIKSVNYDGINAVLIECVKELSNENKAMRVEMEDIKNNVNKILVKLKI